MPPLGMRRKSMSFLDGRAAAGATYSLARESVALNVALRACAPNMSGDLPASEINSIKTNLKEAYEARDITVLEYLAELRKLRPSQAAAESPVESPSGEGDAEASSGDDDRASYSDDDELLEEDDGTLSFGIDSAPSRAASRKRPEAGESVPPGSPIRQHGA